jgi:hypothetical protein
MEGRVAQIDHLLITRLLDIWVFESKHFAEGVGVNEQGEWVAYWNGKPHGIASPVEQNRKHIAVLREAFDQGPVQLPRRLGVCEAPADPFTHDCGAIRPCWLGQKRTEPFA